MLDGGVVHVTAFHPALMYAIALAIAISSVVTKAQLPIVRSAPRQLQTHQFLSDLFAFALLALALPLLLLKFSTPFAVEALKLGLLVVVLLM